MKTYHEYNEDDVKSVLYDKNACCDPGRKLQMVLDALVDANFQEADEDPYDDQDYERRTAAKLFLFKIATALTNGFRNKDEEAMSDKEDHEQSVCSG